jgi:hypothetical protein
MASDTTIRLVILVSFEHSVYLPQVRLPRRVGVEAVIRGHVGSQEARWRFIVPRTVSLHFQHPVAGQRL